jgi:cation transport ATPase
VTQDIGQTVREAVEQAKSEAAQAVRDAQEEVRGARQQVREAQQHVRDAQREVRDGSTADRRSEANQELQNAQNELNDAENELRQAQAQTRSTPMVYTGAPPDYPRSGIPAGAMDIAIGFCITLVVIIVGWPISRALGRRIERRGASQAVDAGVTERLQRIEQAVEAVAIEVERISESQRYLAKIQAR